MSKKIIALVVAIGSASFLGLQAYDDLRGEQAIQESTNIANQHLVDELARLKKAMEELTIRRASDPSVIASVEQQLRQSEPVPKVAHDVNPKPEHTETVQTRTDKAPVKLSQRQMLKRIDERFVLEELDQQWALGIQSHFKELFARYSDRGQVLQSLECRSTLCKLEIVSDEGACWKAVSQVLSEDAFGKIEGFQAKEYDGSGQEKMIMYFTRDGHRLPEQGV